MANRNRKPGLPLPEPLRAVEQPSFTHYSVVKRLPDIARRALEENGFPTPAAEKVQRLIDEIPSGKIRPVEVPLAAWSSTWQEHIEPYLGMDWLEVPWFFAEEYFYLRVLEATGYFHPGEGRALDPYRHQKRLGLESTRESSRMLAEQVTHANYGPPAARRDALVNLLLADLWGNQNDLSMWPVKGKEKPDAKLEKQQGSKSHAADTTATQTIEDVKQRILSDDTEKLLAYLEKTGAEGLRVDILLDNAGYELVTDLALADFLLTTGWADQVVLHAKTYPVFVSDALKNDIHTTIDFLAFDQHPPTQAMAVRLRQALVSDRLVLKSDPFWTSPLALWELPDELYEELSQSDLFISKGDANYRRLLGDRHWPIDTPFAKIVSYMPVGVLALRTSKSEIAVGLDPYNLPQDDPEWMINGRWGLIQFAPPLTKL